MAETNIEQKRLKNLGKNQNQSNTKKNYEQNAKINEKKLTKVKEFECKKINNNLKVLELEAMNLNAHDKYVKRNRTAREIG